MVWPSLSVVTHMHELAPDLAPVSGFVLTWWRWSLCVTWFKREHR